MNNKNNDDNSNNCNSTESPNTKPGWTNSITAIHDEQLRPNPQPPQIYDEVLTSVIAIQRASTLLTITTVITVKTDNKTMILAMNTILLNARMIRATNTEP